MEGVLGLVRASSNKQCLADPLLMWLHKDSAYVLAPFLAALMTASLETSEFSWMWKHATVMPLLKQAGLDTHVTSNYRPVSNLPFLSKLLERIVSK